MQKSFSINQQTGMLSATLARPEVLIFKTNIQTQGDKFYMKPFLDKHPLILEWNIDLEDIDCVLRIVTNYLDREDIIDLINDRGYFCEELV